MLSPGLWKSLIVLGLALTVGISITRFVGAADYDQERGVIPKDGFVPNEKTAVKIAEAVIEPIYGLQCVKTERPFKAKLIGGEWFVTGSGPTNLDWMGGVAEVHINKTNACITFMKHSR